MSYSPIQKYFFGRFDLIGSLMALPQTTDDALSTFHASLQPSATFLPNHGTLYGHNIQNPLHAPVTHSPMDVRWVINNTVESMREGHVSQCPTCSWRRHCPTLSVRVAAVVTSDGHSCRGSGKLALPLPSGFLLGPVRSKGLGSSPASCIHVVTAAEGQRINITLYDFGAYSFNSQSHTLHK